MASPIYRQAVPIIVKKLNLALYPEGGDLVYGLPGRVYFEAKIRSASRRTSRVASSTKTNRPSDHLKASATAWGRVDFTPQQGHRYTVAVDQPVGITDRFVMPTPQEQGCVIRSIDDLDGQQTATRVSVRCTDKRKVVVAATMRENLLDVAAVEADREPATVYLEPRGQGSEALGRTQGAVRVTVFDEAYQPLAERLVYRQRRARLQVQVDPIKRALFRAKRSRSTSHDARQATRYQPMWHCRWSTTRCFSFADDKTGHMLSRLYLEPELTGKVEEPNFYFDLSEKRAAWRSIC